MMDHHTNPEELAQLWAGYVEATKRYRAAKNATDAADAAREVACQACDTAHRAWEAACDDEVRYGQLLRQAAVAFQTASDAAFLTECGINPSSLVTAYQTEKGVTS